jgi:hypothetical protein
MIACIAQKSLGICERCGLGRNRACRKKKEPRVPVKEPGAHRFWQRPTLAPPHAALPSGLRRFTAVFGMGTGGATAPGSPEGWRS